MVSSVVSKEQIDKDNAEFLAKWDKILSECSSDFCFEQSYKEKDMCKCGHYAGLHERLGEGWFEYPMGGFPPSPYPTFIWGKCGKCDCRKYTHA